MFPRPRSHEFEITPRFLAAVIPLGTLFWMGAYLLMQAALFVIPWIAGCL